MGNNSYHCDMRLSIILCISMYIGHLSVLHAQPKNEADQILGIWLTGSKKAKVNIVKCQNQYCGVIVWLRDPYYEDGTVKLDKKNEEQGLQKREILGINIFLD